jgi:hypothetical protein
MIVHKAARLGDAWWKLPLLQLVPAAFYLCLRIFPGVVSFFANTVKSYTERVAGW